LARELHDETRKALREGRLLVFAGSANARANSIQAREKFQPELRATVKT
jgi:hypothetical protein